MSNTVFETLNAIDVSGKTEKKGNLTYLSWAWAWAEFKKKFPSATYEVIKFEGLPYAYDSKTGYMVYTTVTVDDLTHEMWLPVMDFKNKAMIDNATMFDVNKTIMRCLTKNLAMFGLGLYIYAGEDLPEAELENMQKKEIFEQYKSDPEEYYENSLKVINEAIDMPKLEKVWKFINGWRSTMKRYEYITEEQSKDILQAYNEAKKGFENE